jgi:hypothetical protein
VIVGLWRCAIWPVLLLVNLLMIEESTDDQIASSTRCAFSWIIRRGFVNTVFLYISCDANRIQCFVKNVSF